MAIDKLNGEDNSNEKITIDINKIISQTIKLNVHPKSIEVEKDIENIMQKHNISFQEVLYILTWIYDKKAFEQRLYYEAMQNLGINNRIMYEAEIEEKAKYKEQIDKEVERLRWLYAK